MRNKEFWKGFVVAIMVASVVGMGCKYRYLLPVQLPIPWSEGQKIQLLKHYLDTYYIEPYDEQMTEDLMYMGLVAGVDDPYTYYLSQEAVAQQLEENSGHFVGIGVTVSLGENGYPVVEEVTANGPAEQAGILVGDEFIRVENVELSELDLTESVSLLKGEEGTQVTISVFRPETGTVKDVTVTRSDIQVHTVSYELLENEIGYIAVSNFRQNTAEQFQEALTTLENEGMQYLILDLRNNTGGLVNAAYEIGEMLLPEGVMVYTLDNQNKRQDMICDDIYTDIPLVVLVNEKSASASEILAGAIQDKQRGTLVGTTTFGKGLVQRLFLLPDDSGVNITIQKYYTPNGRSIHGIGIVPDVVIEQTESDAQLQKAKQILTQN